MKQEVAKAIRHQACRTIQNHEYVLVAKGRTLNTYYCKHCKDYWMTTPKTDEELEQILMRWRKY